MTDLTRAVQAFLASLGVAAYPAGLVPPGAALPLLTWDMRVARFGERGTITATAWFDGPDRHILRAAFLDTALEAVPEGGLRLALPGGFVLLERGSDFLAPVTDPAHPHLAGGTVRLTLRRFGAT